MDISQIDVESLSAAAEKMERPVFVKKYPGFFLLALGYLKEKDFQVGNIGTTGVINQGRMRSAKESKHPLAGEAFYLLPNHQSGQATMGRGPDCQIVVPDDHVSTKHGLLLVETGQISILDSGTTNGTMINGRPIAPRKPQVIHDQDTITLGRFSLELQNAGTFFDNQRLISMLEKQTGLL